MAPAIRILFLMALPLLSVFPATVLSQFDPRFDPVRAALYACPPGYLVVIRGDFPLSPVECDPDPCADEVVACGPGNVCTLRLNRDYNGYDWQYNCTCTSPYVQGDYYGEKNIGSHTSCFIPGRDVCSPNPCQNGGNCTGQFSTRQPPPVPGGENRIPIIDFECRCPNGFLGKACTVRGDLGRLPAVLKSAPPPPPPPSTGSQGLCGTGSAASFPNRCWYNSDPQGRYVCCDNQGCDGFNSDNLTPHCKNYGYVPPNFGVGGGSSTPPSTPPPSPSSSPAPSASQGVCGTGAAASYPVRCWYNNDPQGRYVCCDSAGCDGFNPPGNFFPRCKNNGYVPPVL